MRTRPLYWETAHTAPGQPPSVREFTGIWQAAEKIVFSKTLASVSSARTRIEPNFDPDMVRQLKSATEHDMTVEGADLAGQALIAGLWRPVTFRRVVGQQADVAILRAEDVQAGRRGPTWTS